MFTDAARRTAAADVTPAAPAPPAVAGVPRTVPFGASDAPPPAKIEKAELAAARVAALSGIERPRKT